MTIPNRTVSLTGVFAKEASTTIPSSPVSGVSYRDTSLTKETVEEGWPYKEIVDSGSFNQMMYEYAYMTDQIEKYGFLPWCSLTDYAQGALCLGSDGVIYQAVQATGPSTTAYDPVSDTSHTYWVDFVGNTYVTLSTTQTISGAKTFSGNVTLGSNARATTPSSATESTTRVATTQWVNQYMANSTIRSNVVGWGMPDYSTWTSISISNDQAKTFTATKNCLVGVYASGTGTACYIRKNSDIARSDVAAQAASIVSATAFVKAGESVTLFAKGGTYVAARWCALHY